MTPHHICKFSVQSLRQNRKRRLENSLKINMGLSIRVLFSLDLLFRSSMSKMRSITLWLTKQVSIFYCSTLCYCSVTISNVYLRRTSYRSEISGSVKCNNESITSIIHVFFLKEETSEGRLTKKVIF